jgi:MoxR-like ATPase
LLATYDLLSLRNEYFMSITSEQAQNVISRMRDRVQQDVMGRDHVIELALIALLSGGHMLLEDYPGSGKTTLAKALGESIQKSIADTSQENEVNEQTRAQATYTIASFRRVQFTPDMLPSDITGVMIFDAQVNNFYFRPGPVFTHVLLADEINRTSPKVQSAMLESMAERQVTVDNQTYPLDELFFVIATQNPLDSVGTYPLPVAQLDRFLFKVQMKHIDRDAELDVLNTWGQPKVREVLPTVTRDEVVTTRHLIQTQVHVHDAIKQALVDIARAIRADKRCAQGVSTRALVQAIPALQAHAFLQKRMYVNAHDLMELAPVIFEHRLTLIPGVRDTHSLVQDAMQAPMETLARNSLQG